MTRANAPRGAGHRRTAWAIGGAAAVVAGFVAAALLVADTNADAASPATASTEPPFHTEPVTRGDLRGTTPQNGRLGRLQGPTIASGLSGTITELPATDTLLVPRAGLYRIDDQAVVAFTGALPQWRAFTGGMADGPDVAQLESNLHDWGYLRGVADAHFDARTASAIRSWQHDVGLPRTGEIEVGRIVFVPGPIVVGDHSATLGERADPGRPLYATSLEGKAVTVELPVGSPLARPDGVVTVRLPSGTSVPGHIRSIGSPKAADDGKTKVSVDVGFDDPAAVGDLTDAAVTVDFVSDEAHDVLSAPVLALGAASGGGFVLDVVRDDGTTRTVPVTVGLFAGDRVQVSGDGVHAGQKVRVPGR